MFLSKEDSTQLWNSVEQHDFSLFNPINQKLLNPQGVNLRHMPVRLYLPHAATSSLDTVNETIKEGKQKQHKQWRQDMEITFPQQLLFCYRVDMCSSSVVDDFYLRFCHAGLP